MLFGGAAIQACGPPGLRTLGRPLASPPRPPQQQAHRPRVCGVRVGDGKDHRAQVRAIEPQRQLAPQHAAAFGGTAAGDDLDAADVVGVRHPKEMRERVEGVLRGIAVQVQPARGRQLPGAQTSPGRIVHTRRLIADV